MSPIEDEMMQETKKFNELLFKNPNNIEIWLDFIKFQKKMYYYLPNSSKNLQIILEKQLNIVEKALENDFLKKNALLILLRIKLLKSSNKGEDLSKTLETAWRICLSENSENLLFWNLFFEFQFTNFIKFNV